MGRNRNENEHTPSRNSLMQRFQPIYDIAELCARKGIEQVVLCPGSRCAPLTLAFARHPHITTRTISDERSAAFIALGMAQASRKTVALVCTSGSAAYNFAPAVAEAYFSHIPLLIFTADRPAEWIGQHDGQTIYQQEIYGKHVKYSFQLPQSYEHPDDQWAINRMVNEAINITQQQVQGPVHINIPFREPLYPSSEETITYSENIRVIENIAGHPVLGDSEKIKLLNTWTASHRILVVAGQLPHNEYLCEQLAIFSSLHRVPIVGDILSNLHPVESAIRHSDNFLGQAPHEVKKQLAPDLLITFGNSIISKNLKLFLRQFAPTHHWHIQAHGDVADTYQHVTQVLRTDIHEFFHFINSVDTLKNFESQKQSNYQKLWEVEERKVSQILDDFFPQESLGEFEIVQQVIRNLPAASHLHLANSMSVRYANAIGLEAKARHCVVHANRGTSGIDGCTSSTVGHAIAIPDVPQVLITGDLAFFYDRNAFWHNYKTPNLRIVLLNNHGGIIFSMIDGPGNLPESETYFVTQQQLNAENLCREFGFEYIKLDSKKKLKHSIQNFFTFDGTAKILEIESSQELNKSIFQSLKNKIKQRYEL